MTYHIALALKEGADRIVQLLYRYRHAAAEIGAFALTKWPSPRRAEMTGLEPGAEAKREVDPKAGGRERVVQEVGAKELRGAASDTRGISAMRE